MAVSGKKFANMDTGCWEYWQKHFGIGRSVFDYHAFSCWMIFMSHIRLHRWHVQLSCHWQPRHWVRAVHAVSVRTQRAGEHPAQAGAGVWRAAWHGRPRPHQLPVLYTWGGQHGATSQCESLFGVVRYICNSLCFIWGGSVRLPRWRSG